MIWVCVRAKAVGEIAFMAEQHSASREGKKKRLSKLLKKKIGIFDLVNDTRADFLNRVLTMGLAFQKRS